MKLFYQLPGNSPSDIEFIRFQLEQTNPEEISEVELDLRNLLIPDSTFLHHLLQIHVYLREQGISLRLTHVGEPTRMILRHSNIDRFLGLALMESGDEAETEDFL